MKVLAVQVRPTLCHPMACSPPDSSIHGIFQARILEWASISFPRESSWRLNLGLPHCRQILYHLSHQVSTKRCFKKQYVKFPSHTHRPTHSWAAPLDSGTADMDNRATHREATTTPCLGKTQKLLQHSRSILTHCCVHLNTRKWCC